MEVLELGTQSNLGALTLLDLIEEVQPKSTALSKPVVNNLAGIRLPSLLRQTGESILYKSALHTHLSYYFLGPLNTHTHVTHVKLLSK